MQRRRLLAIAVAAAVLLLGRTGPVAAQELTWNNASRSTSTTPILQSLPHRRDPARRANSELPLGRAGPRTESSPAFTATTRAATPASSTPSSRFSAFATAPGARSASSARSSPRTGTATSSRSRARCWRSRGRSSTAYSGARSIRSAAARCSSIGSGSTPRADARCSTMACCCTPTRRLAPARAAGPWAAPRRPALHRRRTGRQQPGPRARRTGARHAAGRRPSSFSVFQLLSHGDIDSLPSGRPDHGHGTYIRAGITPGNWLELFAIQWWGRDFVSNEGDANYNSQGSDPGSITRTGSIRRSGSRVGRRSSRISRSTPSSDSTASTIAGASRSAPRHGNIPTG